ncbi:MAG: hypothetical protein QOJ03_2756 [Frankiaceae bacterium]|nr:hypothetical protein [Frankiaceae bacterium]
MSAQRLRVFLPLALLGVAAATTGAVATTSAPAGAWRLSEYRVAQPAMDALRTHFVDQLLRTNKQGTWAPMKMMLGDRDLKLMGLPSKRFLLGHRFSKPTLVTPDGHMQQVALPTAASFAGAGYFGIRPGAWLLTVTDNEIGWCSMAHVYGAPGSYSVSTAGHCGKTGDVGTVIAAAGNRADATGVVLLDFGKYTRSTGDAGIGKDWALIGVDPAYQKLVTPTMAVWGGPRGIYTRTGDVAGAQLLTPKGAFSPKLSASTDPLLVQQIVHYGHGAGIGAGGTPRSGVAITWRPTYFAFFGAITPGDSGSGSNAVTGDLASTMEAAGINTHIYVDASLRTGLGVMAGTRATQVAAALANGQLVSYPVPAPGLP